LGIEGIGADHGPLAVRLYIGDLVINTEVLFSARPAVTFPVKEHHCPLASTKLYCLVTEAYGCD